MFNQIKSSSENKVLITELTRRFGLGAENVIARIAIAYSLHSGLRFSPLDVKDSGGKEYTKNVLFGNLFDSYLYAMCTAYGIPSNNRDIPRYFKIHLDHGIDLIHKEITNNPNLIGFDFLFEKIKIGLSEICSRTSNS